MGSLIVRGLDDAWVARLKRRAAENGRSAEAEHREILRQALAVSSLPLPWDGLRGKIWIAPDSDETPPDVIDAMENGDL
jgi:hypothetical protein